MCADTGRSSGKGARLGVTFILAFLARPSIPATGSAREGASICAIDRSLDLLVFGAGFGRSPLRPKSAVWRRWMMNLCGGAIAGTVFAVLSSVGTAMAGDLDWTELNPAFEGQNRLGDASLCQACHAEQQQTFSHTAHAKAFRYGDAPEAGQCETCHGPRSQHVQSPTRDLALNGAQWTAVCLQCHQGGDRMHWQQSLHAATDVGCTSCHTVMEKKSDRALLAASRQDAVCYECHPDVRSQMNKSSHHPVREGKMQCFDCHAHGSVTAGQLKAISVTELCFSCHQEKRGPYVWEHPPVRESCLNCHEAHGSNNRKLQTSKESFLCLQCHSYGGHINLPRYNRTSNLYGEGCVNCHMAVHGSNSPSGAKLTR